MSLPLPNTPVQDFFISKNEDMDKEFYRLNAMKKYLGLSRKSENKLQDIVMLASYITNTPVAFITLMDKEIQWITVKHGYNVEQMPRATSFCTHTIEQDDIFIVPDTYADERFKQNPVVLANPSARFYAGAPLTNYEGYNVGTLCVLDVKPNQLNDNQRNCLKALSNQVANILELNLGVDMLTKSVHEIEQKKKAIEHQNIHLKKIAQIQSHEFRSPVCSILSLMNLIKYEGYKPSKEYLLMMEDAVKNLDAKICSVVELASSVNYDTRPN
jgi:hypothetical protein